MVDIWCKVARARACCRSIGSESGWTSGVFSGRVSERSFVTRRERDDGYFLKANVFDVPGIERRANSY